MTVTPEELAAIASLAALDLDPAAVPALARHVGRILEYIAQLESVSVTDDPTLPQPYVGPRAALRDDEPHRTPLAVTLHEMAPAFQDGLFLVPRFGGAESRQAEDAEKA